MKTDIAYQCPSLQFSTRHCQQISVSYINTRETLLRSSEHNIILQEVLG